jgi:Sulfotransferase domain
MKAAYDHRNAEVRKIVPSQRLLEWRPDDGWGPICQALDVAIPDEPFPWMNRREDWG